jgi:hypothetical protein
VTRSRTLAWLLLAVWSLWAAAARARLAESLGAFAPALDLVLVLGLAARLPTSHALGLALVGTAGRAALSTEPALATLAAFLGALLFLRAVRSVLDLASPPVLAVATALAVIGAEAWSELVHASRAAQALALADGALSGALATGLASGLTMLLAGPAIAYLPGVTPLRRSSPWSSVASVR